MVALPISDSVLVAYVDNELDATTRERVAGPDRAGSGGARARRDVPNAPPSCCAQPSRPGVLRRARRLVARTARMVERRSPSLVDWLALPACRRKSPGWSSVTKRPVI